MLLWNLEDTAELKNEKFDIALLHLLKSCLWKMDNRKWNLTVS